MNVSAHLNDSSSTCVDAPDAGDNLLSTIVVGALTLSLNSVVMFIAFAYVKFEDKPNQVFVVSMTAADMAVGLVLIGIYPFLHCGPMYVCAPYFFLIWTSQVTSTMFLLLLNIDKLLRFTKPLEYKSLVTRQRALRIAAAVWLSVAACGAYSFYDLFLSADQIRRCIDIQHNPPMYFAVLFLVCLGLPLVASFALSIAIFVMARRARNSFIRQSSNAVVTKRQRHSSGHRNGLVRQASVTAGASAAIRKLAMKRVFFVFSSTIWTTVTTLPYRTVFLFYTFCVTTKFGYESRVRPVAISRAYRLSDAYLINASEPANVFDYDDFSTTEMAVTEASLDRPLPSQLDPTGLQMTANADSFILLAECHSQLVYTLASPLIALLVLGGLVNPIITVCTQQLYMTRLKHLIGVVCRSLRLPVCQRHIVPSRGDAAARVAREAMSSNSRTYSGSIRDHRASSAGYREQRQTLLVHVTDSTMHSQSVDNMLIGSTNNSRRSSTRRLLNHTNNSNRNNNDDNNDNGDTEAIFV